MARAGRGRLGGEGERWATTEWWFDERGDAHRRAEPTPAEAEAERERRIANALRIARGLLAPDTYARVDYQGAARWASEPTPVFRSARDTFADWTGRERHRARVLVHLAAERERPPVTAAQLRARVARAREDADAGAAGLP